MDEWKELEIDNLPSDILIGDYEWEVYRDWEPDWHKSLQDPLKIIGFVKSGSWRYRYRKRQPESPSHEEIMTKWWKTDNHGWRKVNAYFEGSNVPYAIYAGSSVSCQRVNADYFTDRKSSDIPPEV